MRRLLLVCSVLLLATCWGSRLSAQEVDAYADATFDPACNCFYGSTFFDEDYTAYYYYDTQFESELYDQQGNYNVDVTIFDDVEGAAENWTINDPPADDSFSVAANAGGSLDPMYDQCETGSCGQFCNFRNGGSYCYNWCTECPVDAPFALPSVSASATVLTFCPQDGSGPGDLTTMVGEYSPPNAAAHQPIPSCYDFIPAVSGSAYSVPNLPYPNSVIYSQGDISDWALFHSTLLTMVELMNQSLPTGAPTDIPQPIPLTSVYRTPVRNTQVGGTYNEGHQHGIAFDLQTAPMANAGADQKDAQNSWQDMTGWAQGLAVWWWGGSQPICIEPSHFNTNEPNFYHVHVDMRQQVYSPPLRACGDLWKVNVPSWFQ